MSNYPRTVSRNASNRARARAPRHEESKRSYGIDPPSPFLVVHADGYDSKTVDFLNATAAWLLSSSIARLEVTNASVKRDFANDAVISLHMRRTAPTGQPFQFRFPVVTGPGPPRIGFGASVRGLVDVASAIIESRAISRFWCISDAIPGKCVVLFALPCEQSIAKHFLSI